jgi:phospholipid/cholesterol/gamma-HCH transport system substrate-binding protein
MKSATGKELLVGVVFFAILGTLAFFTIVVSGVNPFDPPKKFFVYFDKGVAGLRKGNVVRISGMEVGKVDDMKLIKKGVLVKLVVIPGVRLHPGYSIKVRAFSPLGGKYVDVVRGQTGAPVLELPLKDWPSYSSVDELEAMTGPEGPVLFADTEAELIGELADLAEEIKPTIIEAVNNIRDVTEKMNSMQGTLGKFIGDPAMFDNLTEAAANLNDATDDLADIAQKINEGEGTLSRLVNDPELYDTGVELFTNLGSVARKVDEGRGTVGRLFNDERMAQDLADAAGHLETILEKAAEGDGTVAALLNERELYDELTASIKDLGIVAEKLAESRGPLGVLITDEQAGEDLRRTIAHLERISGAVAEGRGTVGRLIMDDRLVSEAEHVLTQIRESVEDLREQAPISAFTSAIFQAF